MSLLEEASKSEIAEVESLKTTFRKNGCRKLLFLGLTLSLTLGLGFLFFSPSQTQFRLDLSKEKLSPGLTGFYNLERNEVFAYRWSKPSWELELDGLEARSYQLYIGALRPSPETVRVIDKSVGQILTSFVPASQWQTFRLEIPAEVISNGRAYLIFSVPAFASASAEDRRKLGLMVTSIELRKSDSPDLGLVGVSLLGGAGLLGLFLFIPSWPRPVYRVSGVKIQPVFESSNPLPLILEKNRTNILNGAGLWLSGIVLIGLALRVLNPFSLSIFVDESFHIGAGLAAESGRLDTSGLFATAIDSKILHGWMLAALFQLAGNEQLLLVARLFSALCGLVTLIACYGLATLLFSSQRAGILAATLWAIVPFAVWHERLALVDPLMTACTTSALYFSLRLLKATEWKAGLSYSLLTGLALAEAVLTKILALLVTGIPVVALLVFYPPKEWFRVGKRLGEVYLAGGVVALPVIAAYNGHWNGGQQADKLEAPRSDLFWNNLGQVAEWSYAYLTLPLLLLLIAGISFAMFKNRRAALFLLVATLLPLLVFCAVSRVLYPRYLLFMLPPLIVLASGGINIFLEQLASKRAIQITAVGLVVISLPALWLNAQMIASPTQAALPVLDRFQYIEGWPAGGNVEQMAQFLRERQSQSGRPITVIEADYISYRALKVYFANQSNFRLILAQGEAPARLDTSLKTGLNSGPAFFIIDNPKDASLLQTYRWTYPNLDFQAVRTVDRPGQQYQLVAYQICNSSCTKGR